MSKTYDLVWETLPCGCAVKETKIKGEVHYDVAWCALHKSAVKMRTCIEAITARINGVFDNPALKKVGPLSPDTLDDILHIIKKSGAA